MNAPKLRLWYANSGMYGECSTVAGVCPQVQCFETVCVVYQLAALGCVAELDAAQNVLCALQHVLASPHPEVATSIHGVTVSQDCAGLALHPALKEYASSAGDRLLARCTADDRKRLVRVPGGRLAAVFVEQRAV